MDASQISTLIGALGQGIGGISQAIQGGQLSVLGGQMAASAFRQAGVASVAAANYNSAIDRMNFDRQMDVLGRDMRNFMQTQAAQQVSTGFQLTSKSYLATVSGSLNIFERGILMARASQDQAASAMRFEGQAAKVEFENRARAAEYQGKLASAQSMQGLIGAVGGIFGKLFGG